MMNSYPKYGSQPATLTNLSGAHFPLVVLNISSDFQCSVDAGVIAATCFFDELTGCGLHDHIAISAHYFMQSVKQEFERHGMSAAFNSQQHADAFAAGYLGRIQQELRLFHGEQIRHETNPDQSIFNEINAWQTH